MLKQAVAYYHDLLQNENLAEDSFRVLHDGLEHNKLIFGGRPLSPFLRPHFITKPDWTRVKVACEIVWGALQKVKDAAVRDDALLDELGLTEVEKELVKIDPGYDQVSPTARLDSFLTDDSYSFVLGDRVFTGDTLLIRGTGRTDFQNGSGVTFLARKLT